MEIPRRPSLTRRASSNISINDVDFEWLKSYFNAKDLEPVPEPVETKLTLVPPPKAAPVRLPQPVPTSLAGHKHGHDDPLPSMSPHSIDDDDEEDHGKKRRKVGWTNTEDLTILAAVRRIGTQWQRIADNLPGRTADAVRNRWHRLQKTHALNDTDEGRSALDGLLIASGVDPDWCPPELSGSAYDESSGGQSAAEPARIVGSDHGRHMWTVEEDRIIEDGVRRFGCKWRQIAALLPGRTDSSVRNRWMRLCKESQSARSSMDGGDAPPAFAASTNAAASPAPPAPLPLPPAPAATGGVMGAPPPMPQDESAEADRLLDQISDSIKDIEVDNASMPLGLAAPMDVVDLDSFVEAVSACVSGEGSGRHSLSGRRSYRESEDNMRLPSFTIDEQAGYKLGAAPARASSTAQAPEARAHAAAHDHDRRGSESDMCSAGLLSGRMAAAAVATAAVATVALSAFARSRTVSR